MPHLLNLNEIRRFTLLLFAVTLTVLLSSCAQFPNTLWNDTAMAAKEVRDAKAAGRRAHRKEARELNKERQEEKAEDKDFAAMRKQLARDEALAEANPDQRAGVSRSFFDKEMLAMNERVHAISKRVIDLSERVHEMAQRVENMPEKLAELKLELVTAGANIRNSKAPMQGARRPGAPFWGVQIGAYKTRSGAEIFWAEFLADPMAIELTDAKVHYVQSKPLKNGNRLTLIIVNEYANHKAADKACNGLKGRGLDCVAYYVKP